MKLKLRIEPVCPECGAEMYLYSGDRPGRQRAQHSRSRNCPLAGKSFYVMLPEIEAEEIADAPDDDG